MSKYSCTIVALAGIALLLIPASVANATWIPIDAFDDGNDDGWRRIDALNQDTGGGPGIFDASSGEYDLQSTGLVRPIDGESELLSLWEPSSSDTVYSNGFVRARIRNNVDDSATGLVMRVDAVNVSESLLECPAYYFIASNYFDPPQVNIVKVSNGEVSGFGLGPSFSFDDFEYWNIEAGIVGDQLSMKVWRDGDPEPTTPQWMVTDPTPLPDGQLGVATWLGSALPGPGYPIDATFDDIYFHPAVLGDFNSDRVVDVEDIDLLSRQIRLSGYRPQFDLNEDEKVDLIDHGIWVHDLKNTCFGDADLNGKFSSDDFVKVFEAGKYETGQYAGWAEGDWNADRRFTSDDFVTAFIDGGYELGLKTNAVAGVPEPASVLLLMTSLAGVAVGWRRAKR